MLQQKKPFYKRWWFFALVGMTLLLIISKNVDEELQANIQTVYEKNGVVLNVDKNTTEHVALHMDNMTREPVLVAIEHMEIGGQLHMFKGLTRIDSMGLSDEIEAFKRQIALVSYPAKYKEEYTNTFEIAMYEHAQADTKPLRIDSGAKITFTLYFLSGATVGYIGNGAYMDLPQGDSEFNYVSHTERIQVTLQ